MSDARGRSARSRRSWSGSGVRAGLAGRRPASAAVRNGSGQPPGGSPSSPRRNPMTESGRSYFPGSLAKSSLLTPVPTSCSARSPTAFRRRGDLDGPAEELVGGGVGVFHVLEPLAQARARWPADAGWTTGRQESRGCRRGRRRGQAGLERSVEAADRFPVGFKVVDGHAGSGRWPGRCGRWRRRSPIAVAGWSCRPWRRPRHQRRPPPPARRPARWRAGLRRCRGCAGGRVARSVPAAR